MAKQEKKEMSKVSKVVSAGLLAGVLMAGTPAAEAADVTVGADIVSAYVFRGVTVNDEPVIQPSVLIEHESGVGFELWANYDLTDSGLENEFSEVDFILFYGIDVGDIGLEIGYTEYIEAIGDAFREGYIGASYEFEGVELGLTLYQGFSGSDETYIELGAGYGFEAAEGLTLGIEGSIAWGGKGATAAGKSGMHDYLVGINAAFEVAEGLEVGAFFAHVGSLDSDVLPSSAVEEDFFGGISVYYSF